MSRLKHWALSLIVPVILGCAALGITPAQSFDDKLAYAYGMNTALREASTSALEAKTISSEDMEHIMAVNAQARNLLDSARVIGDPKAAESKLVLATSLLIQLQNYLRAKQ